MPAKEGFIFGLPFVQYMEEKKIALFLPLSCSSLQVDPPVKMCVHLHL